MPKKKPAQKDKRVVETWIDRPMFVNIPPASIELSPGQPRSPLDLFTDLRETQNRYEEGLWIRTYCDLFEREHDPIALMQAFVISMNLGIYPPVAILHALAGAFQTVLKGEGKTKLDVVLGLKGKNKGAWNAFTKKNKQGTQHWLASTIHALTTGYGLSVAKAAERVSVFLESRPDLGHHTTEGLIDQYSRTWKRQFHLDKLAPTDFQHPASWTPAFRESFIKRFPQP
jgi:hypothetical protein